MKEPVYDFKLEDKFLPKFEKNPIDQPFNWYLHEYTDKKVINEHVLKTYLKDLSPFEAYPDPAKYKLLGVTHTKPRWLKIETENMVRRKQQYSMIPFKHASISAKKVEEFIQCLPYQQNFLSNK